MEQHSPEWFEARLGKVTASRIADVTAKTRTGVSASRAKYRGQLVAERLGGRRAEGYVSPAMQWGTQYEAEAVEKYIEAYGDAGVTEIGFVQHPRIEWAGASPDRAIHDVGGLECKCPELHTHINTLLTGKVDSRYISQMQWQMACTGWHFIHFISYTPLLPAPKNLFVRKVLRDNATIDYLEREVREFLKEVDWELRQLDLIDHDHRDLKTLLRASLDELER